MNKNPDFPANQNLADNTADSISGNDALTDSRLKAEDLSQILDSLEKTAVVALDNQLRIHHFNAAGARLFNLIEQDAGREFADIHSNICFDDLPGTVEAVLADRQAIELEVCDNRGVHYKLEIKPVGISGDIDRILLICRDIDELKCSQLNLEKNEQRLQDALDSANMFAFDHDFDSGRIFCSRQGRSILGISVERKEMSLKKYFHNVHPDDRDAYSGLITSRTPDDPLYAISYRIKRLDKDEYITLGEQGQAHFDVRGRMVSVTGLASDITERKRLEQNLAGQQELLERLINNIPVMVVMYDPAFNTFTFNQEVQRVLGWTEEDTLDGRFMEKVYPGPEERRKAEEHMRSLKPGWEDLKTTAKDGSVVDSSWANIRLSDNRQVGIGIDVRERKAHVAALTNEKEKLRTFIDYVPAYVYFKDTESRFVMANKNTVQVMRCRHAEELIGRTDFDFYSREMAEKFYQDEQEIIRTGKPKIDIEESIINAHDQVRIISTSKVPLFDAQGKVMGIAGVGKDVTDRRYMEAELAYSEKLYRTLAANLPGGAVFLLDTDCKYVLAEGKTLKEAGLTSEDFIGRTAYDIYNKKTARLYSRFFKQVLSGMGFQKEHELYGRHFVSHGVPIKAHDGSVSYILVVSYDITLQKEAKEVLERDKWMLKEMVDERSKELIAARLEVERSKRLADIGTLAATVAHELRNPLAAISMAVFNLQRKIKQDSARKNLKSIESKVIEGERIIENLLFYSRLRTPDYGRVRLQNLVLHCVEGTRIKPGNGNIDFQTKKIGMIRDLVIDADEHQLKEVFFNLLNNAADAVDSESGCIEIGARKSGNTVQVVIKDNGCGIPPDTLEKIRDPFVTTKARGTGLGLTVCDQIIGFHNGTLDIDSREGEGTTMTVILPVKKS
ncbi:MAG: PAS domain-containing protein [Candidatus Omnitrophota bacterium]